MRYAPAHETCRPRHGGLAGRDASEETWKRDASRLGTARGSTFSVVGEGTGPLGDFYELLDEKTSIATIEQALASGVKVFNSSPHYGNGLAESRMGAGLRRAKRNEILVSTKIGRIMDPFTKPPKPRSDVVSPGFAGGHPHAPRFDYSYDGAMRSIEHSLLRLGLSRVDIVLIHDCDVWTHGKEEAPGRFKEAMEGAYRALDKLRNEKVVKAIGFGINEADTCVKFARGWRFRCRDDGRTLYADRPDGLGRVSAARLGEEHGRDAGGRVQFRHSGDRIGTGRQIRLHGRSRRRWSKKVKAIEEICRKHKVTLRQAAIQFAAAHPAVVSIVLGAVKPEEVKANVHDATVEIPASLWSDLKAAKLLDSAAPTKG